MNSTNAFSKHISKINNTKNININFSTITNNFTLSQDHHVHETLIYLRRILFFSASLLFSASRNSYNISRSTLISAREYFTFILGVFSKSHYLREKKDLLKCSVDIRWFGWMFLFTYTMLLLLLSMTNSDQFENRLKWLENN